MKVCTTCGKEWPDETKFCPDDGSTLRSASGTADMIGSIIADRYHVTKKLGEGGMGAVYLGEHVKMGRKSAIKVMVSSMASDPDAVARFNREAANAARINHHNVCGIYDFGETKEGVIYLAMEFIEGEALTDLLEREGALPPARAADILRQCTDALQAAHDLGIVHRDIKPDNIMMARQRDGRDLVKVVDFGIAKAVGGEEGQNVTKTGLVVGTPEYMSPEQLSGDKLDGRSDVYSIALVFYRMLTGTLPFQADTAQETMIKRLTDEPMKLAQALPSAHFPPAIQNVMDRALQRIPNDRYSTAHEFGADVMAAVGGAAPGAAAPVYDDGATQLLDSAEVGALAAEAADQIAPTRVASAAERTPTPDTAQPVAAAATPPKKKPVLAIAASIIVVALGGGTAAMMMRGNDEPAPTPQPVAQADSGADTAGTGGGTSLVGQQGDPSRRATSPNPSTNRPSNDRTARDTSTATPPVDNSAVTTPDRSAEIAGITGEFESLRNELLDMLDPDAARLGEMRQTLMPVYNDFGLPDSLRAAAADITAETHLLEGNAGAFCTWSANATRLDPRRTYTQTRQRMGC